MLSWGFCRFSPSVINYYCWSNFDVIDRPQYSIELHPLVSAPTIKLSPLFNMVQCWHKQSIQLQHQPNNDCSTWCAFQNLEISNLRSCIPQLHLSDHSKRLLCCVPMRILPRWCILLMQLIQIIQHNIQPTLMTRRVEAVWISPPLLSLPLGKGWTPPKLFTRWQWKYS